MPHIVVIAGNRETGIHPVTFELIHLARILSARTGHPVLSVLAGRGSEENAEILAGATGTDVLALSLPGDGSLPGAALGHALRTVLPEYAPAFILMAHDAPGLELAPVLAVDFEGACITGVTGAGDNGVFLRPVANGKFVASICPEAYPCVLTVAPGSFPQTAPETRGKKGAVRFLSVDCGDPRILDLGKTDVRADTSALTDARVIIAGGRGFKNRDELSILSDVAALCTRSAVAGSRPMIDQGWMPYRQQVGITGAAVAPALYLACGISGSTQHLAGMMGSGFVVAVNRDPHAAIFNVSDIMVVEEVVPFLAALVDAIEKRKNATPAGGQ